MNNRYDTVKTQPAMARMKRSSGHGQILSAMLGLSKLLCTSSLVMVSGMGASYGVELAPGTLPVASTQLRQAWRNAASSLAPNNTLVIDTASQQVNPNGQNSILWWDSFNIAADSRVQFIQPSASHIALNRIASDTRPSIINGRLEANGHVYLINPNGILFGRHSSINVNRLVASSLALNVADDNDFIQGNQNIANLINQDRPAFADVFAAKHAVDANGHLIVDDQGNPIGYANRQAGPVGAITLQGDAESRASISTPEGGDVLIFGSQIFHDGDIQTPGGQTLMAATDDKVYLTPSSDTNLRGFLVEVSSHDLNLDDETTARLNIDSYGEISAERGNITLAALSINHQGLLQATTSVNENGSIRLVARDDAAITAIDASANIEQVAGYSPDVEFAPQDNRYAIAHQGGRVRVDGDVLIVPDASDDSQAPDQQVQKRSRIEVTGKDVRLASHANLLATAGKVSLHATENPALTATNQDTGELRARDASSIVLESGSRIDVSGTTDSRLAMSRNQLEVQLTADFLRDAPYQRDGALRGERIRVDAREGTPLGDISDTLAGINKGLSERLADGGSIDILSQGGVLVDQGSRLDASGGLVSYDPGYVESSRLIAANRQLVNVADADASRQYLGSFGTARVAGGRWGPNAERSWRLFNGDSRRFYEGYVEGRNGGSINIQSYAAALEGELVLDAHNGRYQRQTDSLTRARGGNLNITLGVPKVTGAIGSQDVVIADLVADITDNDLRAFLAQPDDRVGWALGLQDDMINDSGLSQLTINTNGRFDIAADAAVRLAPAASIDVTSGSISVDGSVQIESGSVSLANLRLDQGISVSNDIDVSGGWVNDSPYLDGVDLKRDISLHGGSILLDSQGDLSLSSAAALNVNGGGWMQTNGQLRSGNAGSIELAVRQIDGAAMDIRGDLQGYALGRGGRLKITANKIVIGDDFSSSQPMQQGEPGELLIRPEFFNQGGFADFDLSANIAGLTLRADTVIAPQTESVQQGPQLLSLQSGSDISQLPLEILQDTRRLPNSLSLQANRDAANGSAISGLSIETGAEIRMFPGSDVRLTAGGETDLVMNGSVYAPGGTVTLLTQGIDSTGDRFDGNQVMWLNGLIDVSGAFVQAPPVDNVRSGRIYDGGTVNLIAGQLSSDIHMRNGEVINNTLSGNGFIVSGRDSDIRVRGTIDELDVATALQGDSGEVYQRQHIASRAGDINVYASEGMLLAGHMDASAVDYPGAAGGSINIFMDTSLNPDVPTASQQARNIHVYQQLNDLPTAFVQGRRMALSDTTQVDQYVGQAFISADAIEQSGAARLALSTERYNGQSGRIIFHNDIDLSLAQSLQLTAPVLQGNHGVVNLTAAYVRLGSLDRGQLAAGDLPTQGDAVINVLAAGQDANGQRDGLLEISGDLLTESLAELNLGSAGDIRFRGLVNDTRKVFESSLQTYGDLNLLADQVYASTLSQVDISVRSADATLRIDNGDDAGSPVLSAGSRMTFSAPVIEQSGVVRAPFGQLVFNASRSLLLDTGSVTSVSGDGQLVPFGVTRNELDWVYPVNESFSVFINSNDLLNGKAIDLNSDDINIASAAQVDLSGGQLNAQGQLTSSDDLFAWEFVPGQGGSRDNLQSDNLAGAFAVLPAGDSFSPYDYIYWETDQQFVNPGEQVYLQASDTLPAGLYTVLPPRYALLPGAHLVTPLAANGNTREAADLLLPAQQFNRYDGSQVVAGQRRYAASDFSDSNWSGFLVESSDAVHLRSQYIENHASQFFRDQALRDDSLLPAMPEDAGSLNISAASGLRLAGDIRGQVGQAEYRQLDGSSIVEDGRGSQVNISGTDLTVVNQITGSSSGVEIRAADLNQLNVNSLLLGGRRSLSDAGTLFDIRADNLTIAENVQLDGRDIILAARQNVSVRAGAHINATGATSKQDEVAILDEAGALLRVSAADQLVIDRTAGGSGGNLTVAAGASLTASNSIVLDASAGTRFDGSLAFVDEQGMTPQQPVGSLNLGASKITIGNNVAASGVAFSADEIQAFNARELVLTSRGSIDLYGDLDLQFANLNIQAASLDGYQDAGQNVTISAQTLTLGNAVAATSATGGSGNGQLTFNTTDTRFLDGDFAIKQFADVTINASNEITAIRKPGSIRNAGETRFDISGNVFFNSARLTTQSGVSHSIVTDPINNTTINIAPAATPAEQTINQSIGGSLAITADRINHRGSIELHSGHLNMQARAGDVQLADASVIDMSGIQRDFAGEMIYTDGGDIRLLADHGNVNMQGGAVMDVSSATTANGDGANAGRIAIATPGGQASLNGHLHADHGVDAKGGYFELDTASMGNLASLNGDLNNAGFTQRRDIRVRTGDLLIADDIVGGSEIIAHEVSLSADNGNVILQGQIDASGDNGGRVSLAANDNLRLMSTAAIDASARSAEGDGGLVFMETCGAVGAAGLAGCGGSIDLAAGSVIDVSAGSNGRGGKLHLRAPRLLENSGIRIASLAGELNGFERFDIEGYWRYDGLSSLPAALTGAASYMSNNIIADAVSSGGLDLDAKFDAATLQRVHLRPGIEITSATNMDIVSAIDFMPQTYTNLANGQQESGVFTLRAAADLNIAANIQDGIVTTRLTNPFRGNSVSFERLQDKDTWSYRLVAGADLGAADSLRVNNEQGDMNLADRVKLRTGTGDITLSVGGLFSLGSDAAVYTAGKPTLDNPRSSLALDFAGFNVLDYFILPGVEFPDAGGDLRVAAGRGISASLDSFNIGDWLHKAGGSQHSAAARFDDGETPIIRGVSLIDFGHGLAALGGGDITIESGGDISNLGVSIPTTIKPVDAFSVSGADANFAINYVNGVPAQKAYEYLGGGNIDIHASGDMRGSLLYADRGRIDVDIAGKLGDVGPDNGMFIVSADTQVDLHVGQDVNLYGISNSSWAPTSVLQDQKIQLQDFTLRTGEEIFFTSYSEDSSLAIQALGDVNILNRFDTNTPLASTIPAIQSLSLKKTNFDQILQFYPADLQLRSIDGSIAFDRGFTMMPSAQGELSLLANNDVVAVNSQNEKFHIIMPDFDLAGLPNVQKPVNDFVEQSGLRRDDLTSGGFAYAQTPLHLDNPDAVRVVARTGDIRPRAASNEFLFILPKKSEFIAGRDILGLGLIGQQLDDTDLTLVQAGRDIRYVNSRSTQLASGLEMGIKLGGPGNLQVLAGRTIDLGDRDGIIAEGSNRNPQLANISNQGADILVMAGLGKKDADYNAFIDTLFPADVAVDRLDYANQLIAFTAQRVDAVGTDSDFASALDQFRQLPQKDQREFLLVAFMQELTRSSQRASAEQVDQQTLDVLIDQAGNVGLLNHNEQDSRQMRLGYSRGLDAIDTLFQGSIQSIGPANGLSEDADPNTLISADRIYQLPVENPAYNGDLALTSSIIKSEADGSDILVAAPGGFVNVGLSVATGDAKDRGIIARGNGNIGIFAHNDVAVNESRIQALAGGDIVVWSSKGNVDAGRGATTLLNVPPPRAVLDPNSGEIKLVNDVSVQGSGIRATSSSAETGAVDSSFNIGLPTSQPSNVVLAAPDGVIDAGDAGIGAGNLTLATDTVLNAGNIEVSGDSVGVPSADAGVISVPTVDPNAMSGGDDAELVATDASDQFGQGSVAILRVEVIDLENDTDVPGSKQTEPANDQQPDNRQDENREHYLQTSMIKAAGH